MIEIIRDTYTDLQTIGEMHFDGEFLCDTLEDTVRLGDDGIMQKDEKVYGETAIPPGTYEVIINDSVRFKRKMPLLLNVPFFSGIRIHSGVTEKSTLGCILVGERKPNPWHLENTIPIFNSIVLPRIAHALKKGKLFCEVRNG